MTWNTGCWRRTAATTGSGLPVGCPADRTVLLLPLMVFYTDEKHETNERLHRALNEAENARNELLLEHEVISAISQLYFSIYTIDLVQNFYEEISGSEHPVHRLTGHGGNAQEKLYELCSTLVAKDYRSAVMQFFDLSTVAGRMNKTNTIEIEYFAVDGNWHQARFLEKKRDETGKVTNILYVTRIVSKQKQQEMEQERLRIAYHVAENANAAKTTFLLNMSHDIRTPMNAILGYSQLMRSRITDPQLLHYQDMIEQSGNQLLSIINNVLDMARIESGKMELDENYNKAGNIVNSVCSVFEMEAKRKNLTIEHIVDVQHPHIICDYTKMQEILANLISNAVKYTPPGGKVTISSREIPCEREGYINIRTVVEDTGIGISAEYYEKTPLAASVENADFSGKHILLAEDNELNSEIATAILEEMGFTVDHAENGIFCVGKLEKQPAGTYAWFSWTSRCQIWTAIKPRRLSAVCRIRKSRRFPLSP